jgi:hypothetical protein
MSQSYCCHRCATDTATTLQNLFFRPMILCPTCGNKRCPKANNHLFTCTGSNDTGQQGSAYP